MQFYVRLEICGLEDVCFALIFSLKFFAAGKILKCNFHIKNSILLYKLFYSTEAGLLNKSSSLAPTSGVTKYTNVKDMILVTLCCAT
jgi:hypothetical protein